ncbi:hypothetical protein FACS1894176_03110 [Bacteroidia bacterium]|nr:hypothetical protein FACS1894176_03110 [Bacteroidia bacterium]
MQSPLDIGSKSVAFTYTSTLNTANYTNDYVGKNSNDVFYKFTLSKAMEVTISHCNSAISDTYLHLLDASGTRIAYNDDYSGEGKCSNTYHSYLKQVLPVGIYYVVSEGYSQNGNITTSISGTLALISALPVTDIGSKNNSFSYENMRNTTTTANYYVGRSSNDVLYKFTLAKPMEIFISHCGSEVSDTYLHLLDVSGTLIVSNDDYSGVGKCTQTTHSYLKRELAAGTYYVVSEGSSQNGNITTSITGVVSLANSLAGSQENGSDDHNYIASRTYTTEDGKEFIDAVQYFDGLGRPIETVQRGITPAGADLITYQEYDAFGRESKSWLPAIASGNNGAFVDLTNFITKSTAVYNNTTYNAAADAKPYSYPVYEASPLNRVQKQYGPGQDWQSISSNHPVSIDYNTNVGIKYQCVYYYVSGDNLVKSGNYATKQLFVTETTDEDGHISIEMKDKLGRVVLQRQMDGTVKHDTYYVYDDFGNLRYMLSPKASDALTANQTYTPDNANIKKLAYVYWYDSRNRVKAKRIPGCEPIYYIYDKADRLIFSQDGEQRAKSEWAFSIPDVFGRTVLTGICKNSLNHETNPLQTTVVKAERPNPNTNNAYKGYNISGINLTTPTILAANYYDDYLFLGYNGIPNNTDVTCETVTGYGTRYTGGYKGLLTGTLTAILNASTPTYLYSVLYYDYKGQLIQSKSSNHLAGGVEKEYFAYNFTGQPTKRKHVHSATGKTTQIEVYTYDYDHAGRLTQTKHQLNSGTEVILADNTYDELGRLKTTQAAGKPSLKQTYGYNIRSWTNSISGQLFSEKLYYNEIFGQGTEYYNGNIATIIQTPPGAEWSVGYNYFYDAVSQLSEARNFFVQNGNAGYGNSYDTHYGYDKNGNITYLSRMEDWGYSDVLQIAYDGNRMLQTQDIDYDDPDYESDRGGFIDYSNNPNAHYEYNANGGMTKDPFKGAEYAYNYLNLPDEITVPAIMGKIDYQYTTSGQKLKASYEWCPSYSLNPVENTGKPTTCTLSTKITDYVGNVIYENNNLKRILTDNGYIEGGVYYFYLKDHLGNNAVLANANGQSQQYNFYYPYGMTSSNESWNLNKQPYKFGGKEYETMHGLNLLDFVARPYDPVTGRFLTPDPLAEKYPWLSTYAYCANNPVKYVDPNGEDLYLYYYMGDNYENGKTDEASNRMFWAATATKLIDIAKSLKDGDKAVFKSISSTSDFKSTIEGDIADNKEAYGQTKEVGIWSHGGFDGPLRHPQDGPNDQLPVSDWSNIDFNWSSDGASIGFYGCQTGKTRPSTGLAFNEILSGYDNFSNVDVWGQTSRSWPSPYTNYRYATAAIQSSNHGYPTYMVGSHKGIMGFLTRYSPMPASVMSIFRNGTLQGYGYQSGKRLN